MKAKCILCCQEHEVAEGQVFKCALQTSGVFNLLYLVRGAERVIQTSDPKNLPEGFVINQEGGPYGS